MGDAAPRLHERLHHRLLDFALPRAVLAATTWPGSTCTSEAGFRSFERSSRRSREVRIGVAITWPTPIGTGHKLNAPWLRRAHAWLRVGFDAARVEKGRLDE